MLNISTIQKDNKYKAFNEKTFKYYADAKHVETGMVQGWNKFCLTGGIIEFSAKLPGDPKVGGLWPALWMLGNLARATYVGSSNFIWPFSYDQCDEETRHSQKISSCSKVGHYGMDPNQGRGSPEIDILEAMMGGPEKLPNTNITRPYFSTSLQIAPGLEGIRPNLGKLPKKVRTPPLCERCDCNNGSSALLTASSDTCIGFSSSNTKQGRWYEGVEYGSNNTQLNPFFYGVTLEHKPKQFTYQSDAISANTHLTKDFFKHFHKYSVEWEPPNDDGTGGYLKWFIDGKFLYGIKGENLALTNTKIPDEPMYVLMNTAVASSWGFPKPCPEGCDCKCYECGNPECMCGMPDGFCENLPASFEIEYVRAYQAKGDGKHELGCSTKKKPTAKYIQGHPKDYMNVEDGQKVPLQPVANGGGYCTQDSHCGAPTKGSCSSTKRCVCQDNFTGPLCLSPPGFDDNPPPPESIGFASVFLSPGFTAIVVFAVVAFISFVGLAVVNRRRQQDGRYDQLPPSNDPTKEMVRVTQQQGAGSGSYQQAGAPYNGSNEQKTVTYCMIDGRLLDEK